MRSITRIIAAVAVALTLAAGTSIASAVEFNEDSHGTYVDVAPSGGQGTPAAVSPTIVRVTPASNGFDWGDAAIGAAGGAALVLLLGGGLAVSQRRTHDVGPSGMRHA